MRLCHVGILWNCMMRQSDPLLMLFKWHMSFLDWGWTAADSDLGARVCYSRNSELQKIFVRYEPHWNTEKQRSVILYLCLSYSTRSIHHPKKISSVSRWRREMPKTLDINPVCWLSHACLELTMVQRCDGLIVITFPNESHLWYCDPLPLSRRRKWLSTIRVHHRDGWLGWWRSNWFLGAIDGTRGYSVFVKWPNGFTFIQAISSMLTWRSLCTDCHFGPIVSSPCKVLMRIFWPSDIDVTLVWMKLGDPKEIALRCLHRKSFAYSIREYFQSMIEFH